jgi:hypothetical protein
LQDGTRRWQLRNTAGNPSSSGGRISSLYVDVSAWPGQGGSLLESSGAFHDLTSIMSPVPVEPPVPLGPVSSNDWRAFLTRVGQLPWNGVNGDRRR